MIASERGYPTQVRVDNGPEFISHQMAGWAWRHAVRIHFIQPGKPAQNGFVEHFNRRTGKMGYTQVDIWSKYYRGGEDGLVLAKEMTWV